MIVITYDPPGAEAQRWELDEDSWTYGETVAIEREYGGLRKDFFAEAADGSDTARRILLWAIRRRTEPDLQLDDLDDLLVSYLGFWKITPAEPDPEGDDPKADAGPDAPAESVESSASASE